MTSPRIKGPGIFWLLRKMNRWQREEEVVGIISIHYACYLHQIDEVIDLRPLEWTWEDITKPQFETYREFGFRDFTNDLLLVIEKSN